MSSISLTLSLSLNLCVFTSLSLCVFLSLPLFPCVCMCTFNLFLTHAKPAVETNVLPLRGEGSSDLAVTMSN